MPPCIVQLCLMGDKESALDATQEAFSRAYARWGRLNGQPWAGGWVMTTAINLCRRSARRHGTAALHNDGVETTDVDLHADIAVALRKLPLRQRQALLLHFLADLPVAAVADLMGTSEGTVKTPWRAVARRCLVYSRRVKERSRCDTRLKA